MKGTILKGISGFYYVLCDGDLYECKARGIFKKRGITPLAGDEAEIELSSDGAATVTEIYSRLNSFDRPPAANVKTMVVVMSAVHPDIDFTLLDRFIINAEYNKAKPMICITKIDLADESLLCEIERCYKGLYPVFFVNGKTGDGTDALKNALAGTQAALAGPSGAGKSTLINILAEHAGSITGDISQKSMRGKNTTRHTELFIADGFSVFDTPGFTSFDAEGIPKEDLQHFYPEFAEHLGKCRFDDCMHIKEPDCSVRSAVTDGRISQRRYQSYLDLYKVMSENEKY